MAKVQFGLPYKAADGVQNQDGFSVDLINGYRLPLGEQEQFIKNTGLSSFYSGLPGISQGAYEDIAGTVLCVANGIVHELSSDGILTAYSGSTLNVTNRCTFTEDGSYVFAAHGGYIAKIDTSAQAVTLLSSGPNNVTHIAYKKGYLLANGLISGGVTGDINYSDDSAGGYVSWEVFNNEQSPDSCTSLVVGWDSELYAFGPSSVELSINGTDPDNPWEALPGAVMEYGTPAPYSVVLADNTIFWLTVANNRRSIVRMVERAPQVISNQYDTMLNEFSTVSDAAAWVQAENDQTFYVITFPTENKTLQYNMRTNEWSERAYWNQNTASFERYRGNFAVYIKGWNKHLIGDHSHPNLYELSGTNDNGDLIRLQLTSGNNDFGAPQKKRNIFDVVRFQGGTNSDFTIRYRDDYKKWSNPKIISTGSGGEYDSYRRIAKAGVYRSRQYEIVHTGDTEFIFTGMDAQFMWLGR